MPFKAISLQPGVNVETTANLTQNSWTSSQLVRFRDGMAEKLGGWSHMNHTTLTGTCRGMWAWADFAGNAYAIMGTEQRLEVYQGGSIFDVTPWIQSDNSPVNFSTVINTPNVTVIDASYSQAVIGDWVQIVTPVSVGGIVLHGFYQVTAVPSPTSWTIVAASNATSTVNNGGAVPTFTTVFGQANIKVTLANNGLSNGSVFQIDVTTVAGGITMMAGQIYGVTGTIGANQFIIAPGPNAVSSGTTAMNGGSAAFNYLLHTGLVSAVPGSGYGIGIYGAGLYGSGGTTGSNTALQKLRNWFIHNWGEQALASYTGGTLYFWQPPYTFNNVAQPVPNAPKITNGSFIGMPEQIAIAWGCSIGATTTQDPNLLRWSDVSDYTDWTASASNQAGSFRFPSGSEIVGCIQGAQSALIFTDVDMWLMTYIGAPLVFGFQKIADGVDLYAPRAVGLWESTAVWVTHNAFHVWDGNSVQIIPCTVWDTFFQNLNETQKDKIFCAVNSWYSEAAWFYPTADSQEINMYVKYNLRDHVWDYGSLIRTAWQDDNVFGAPIGIDTNGYMQQHETSPDADGQPLIWFIQSGNMTLDDGTNFCFLERLIPDFNYYGGPDGPNPVNPQVQVSIITQDYPTDPSVTYGPFVATPTSPNNPGVLITRARGRVFAFRYGDNTVGSWARTGATRALYAKAGRR